MKIEYKDNIKEFTRKLKMAGISLQEAGAEALNLGAAYISMKYKANLKKSFRLRNEKFTLGAIRIFKAHSKCSKGTLRKLRDVNAVIGVVNMKNGRKHYLAKQEEGGKVKGLRKTGGKVPVPLVAARQGGNISKPVAKRYRIDTGNVIPLKNLYGLNPRQQYGAMRSMARRGKVQSDKLYLTDKGIYKITKKRITQLRNTEETQVIIKANPVFQKSVNQLTDKRMISAFQIAAKRLLARLK